MTLARLEIMLGLLFLMGGGFVFIYPATFIYSGEIISFTTTYGALLIPGLGTNPSLAWYIEKSPAFLFLLIGLVLILAGTIKSCR